MLRVSEAHKGDLKYWQALHHEINNSGVAAMMYELMAMDLTDFNIRAKPSTRALLEQKLLSLDHIERWWFDGLESGYVEGESTYQGHHNNDEPQWPEFISTEDAIQGIKEVSGGGGNV